MELTWVMLFACSIALMVIVFFAFFSIKEKNDYGNHSSNSLRIIAGSLVAGAGSGTILGILLMGALPTYHYLTAPNVNGYHTKYVCNGNFFEEHGKTYVVNQLADTCYIMSMLYGDIFESDESENMSVYMVEPGDTCESPHSIDAFFEPFPNHVVIKKRESSKIMWHVLTKDMFYEEIGESLVSGLDDDDFDFQDSDEDEEMEDEMEEDVEEEL